MIHLMTVSIAPTLEEKLANWRQAYTYLLAKVSPGPGRDQVLAEVKRQIDLLEETR